VLDRAVLLAASGQHLAARTLIDEYQPPGLTETQRLSFHRFVRQLRRWLDAGGPPIPPLEESLREMPELRMPQPPSWSRSREQSRQQSRASREALLAVREKAGGKSRDQIGDLLAAEFTARGLDAPTPMEAAVAIDMLEIGRRPFGKARQKWRALQFTGKLLGDTVNTLRGRQAPNPEWMAPPEHASYPIRIGGGFGTVDLAADAADVLQRAAAEASQRFGPQIIVDLWLSESAPGTVSVHLVPASSARSDPR
jgi:hypothetical protein